jgi:hypothetical protein
MFKKIKTGNENIQNLEENPTEKPVKSLENPRRKDN